MDISPDKQNINAVFSNTTYYIDFYQRDYKWTTDPVEQLMEDIFYKFNLVYAEKNTLDASQRTVQEEYTWYYLNTYVTNTIEGKVYVVDGQQRLTTLTLILIALHKIADVLNSEFRETIGSKICGHEGLKSTYWMRHEKHLKTLEYLYEKGKSKPSASTGITAENMVKNFEIIDNYLTTEFNLKGDSDEDDQRKHKFETFVFYFLYRLVLVRLDVEHTEVPMVFEVINDRGVGLKPYEILKGKLLGQINKNEVEPYNELWEERVKNISEKKGDMDSFFRYYLRAKHANKKEEGGKFESRYHQKMFSSEKLNLKHNPSCVKSFLNDPFTYYTSLYSKLLEVSDGNKKYPFVHFNKLTEMNSQFMLILSGIGLNDPEEEDKIRTLSYEVDRLYALLQLQNAYSSLDFNDKVYLISADIREQPVEKIRDIFNKYLFLRLEYKKGAEVDQPFQYKFFKDMGAISLDRRFLKYFFARVELFLAEGTNMELKHSIKDLVQKGVHQSGFHIEHIISRNKDNKKLFGNEEDDVRFETQRNRLGGLLLLKGKDNSSSGDEPYSEKLKTYANTLYWNETLREDSYKSKLDMDAFKKKFDLDLKPLAKFEPKDLEERQKLLFKIANIIWDGEAEHLSPQVPK